MIERHVMIYFLILRKMATRRSRLQIKPNLGGPKPPPKPSTSSSGQQKNLAEEKPKSVTKTDAPPVKQIFETEQCNSSTRDVVVSRSSNESTVVTSIKKNTTESGIDGNVSNDVPSASIGRARLRRFGKVNLAAAAVSNSKSKTEPVKDKEEKLDIVSPKSEAEKVKDNSKFDGKSSKSLPVDASANVKEVEKDKAEDQQKTATVQRRSRFPKVKPNVADVTRRKQR